MIDCARGVENSGRLERLNGQVSVYGVIIVGGAGDRDVYFITSSHSIRIRLMEERIMKVLKVRSSGSLHLSDLREVDLSIIHIAKMCMGNTLSGALIFMDLDMQMVQLSWDRMFWIISKESLVSRSYSRSCVTWTKVISEALGLLEDSKS
jgi:hypothetical protein